MEDRPLFSQLATFCITIAILFLYFPRPALGQQAVTDYVYGLCNTATFTTNSTFSQNFNALMGVLTQQASKILYSNSSETSGSSNASYVYGMYQCRGDVSLSGCSSCVSNALLTNRACSSAVGARVQYKGCYIRYENYNFLGVAENNLAVTPTCSTTQDSNSLYQTNLARVLNDTATAAPAHAVFGYNASSVGEGNSTAYALAQCVGYLSSQQCATCLSQVSYYKTVCNNSMSGEVYFVTCYYLFDHSSFLFTSTIP